ncbi:hypothetical protein [Aneurinibacillus migulanus]
MTTAYVTNNDSDEVSVINTQTHRVIDSLWLNMCPQKRRLCG